MVRAMLAHAVPLPIDGDLVDTCGTGGDGSRSVNVSTMAAFVMAGAGVKVCKHGGRAATSAAGSADVLEALGVAFDLSPHGVARCVAETGMGFCFAPRFHPAMRFAIPGASGAWCGDGVQLPRPVGQPGPSASSGGGCERSVDGGDDVGGARRQRLSACHGRPRGRRVGRVVDPRGHHGPRGAVDDVGDAPAVIAEVEGKGDRSRSCAGHARRHPWWRCASRTPTRRAVSGGRTRCASRHRRAQRRRRARGDRGCRRPGRRRGARRRPPSTTAARKLSSRIWCGSPRRRLSTEEA